MVGDRADTFADTTHVQTIFVVLITGSMDT